MNRKQRRASFKHDSQLARHADSSSDEIGRFLLAGADYERRGNLDDAVRAYKRVLVLKPDHAQACNNLGRVLQALGKTKDASVYFARSLALMPQLLQQYDAICATLVALLPPLGEALRRQQEMWPRLGKPDELFGQDFDLIASDALFLHLLQSTPVRDIRFERLLTSLRRSLLASVDSVEVRHDGNLAFACALAKQCFINEYIFATTPEEDGLVNGLVDSLASTATVEPMQIAVTAMYCPLHAVGNAAPLLDRRWPQATESLLDQQLRAPALERAMRDSITRLTPIEDRISQQVRKQYEENPYPRWVQPPGQVSPKSIDQYLREQFPLTHFVPLEKTDALDVLIAGCGTGQFAIASAQKYLGARILAIDLSLSSLCYAKRNTPAPLATRIDYAQADILHLASIGRSFDIVDASGVLHHMADPFEAWRILLSLVRPGGFMHIGLYSETGRGDVVAAREFISQHGFGTTPAEIRRCRQELLKTPLASLSRFNDFFTTSECRDLLFHVQEARIDIPAIKTFIADQGVEFLGFEFDLPLLQRHHAHFTAMGWSLTDLDRWHAYETENSSTFSGMYQFWIQKP